MKLEYVIKDLILNNKIKTQTDLTEILSEKGYSTTQSNISRILKKLNTVKVVDEEKNTYYVIQPKPLEIIPWIKNLVNTIKDNGNHIVIKTYAGAAGLIAQIIDERNISNIIGTLAGDNVVIVSVENINKLDETASKLKSMFLEN